VPGMMQALPGDMRLAALGAGEPTLRGFSAVSGTSRPITTSGMLWTARLSQLFVCGAWFAHSRPQGGITKSICFVLLWFVVAVSPIVLTMSCPGWEEDGGL
jgi:hypothetical protein